MASAPCSAVLHGVTPAWLEPVEHGRPRLGLRAIRLMLRERELLRRQLRALLREIVLASPPSAPGALEFDGASSFMLWGAIALNAESGGSELDMAQALAHESGHNLLFGLCAAGRQELPVLTIADLDGFAG